MQFISGCLSGIFAFLVHCFQSLHNSVNKLSNAFNSSVCRGRRRWNSESEFSLDKNVSRDVQKISLQHKYYE